MDLESAWTRVDSERPPEQVLGVVIAELNELRVHLLLAWWLSQRNVDRPLSRSA